MKVIFLQNIRGVGQIGDVSNVADGYARNFLLPRGLAKPATQASVKEIEALQAKREIVIGQERERAQEAAAKLADVVIELTGKANEQGTLFAAVGPKEVAERLKKDTGIVVEPDMIAIDEHHLKTLGEHTVTVNLGHDVNAPVKVVISEE